MTDQPEVVVPPVPPPITPAAAKALLRVLRAASCTQCSERPMSLGLSRRWPKQGMTLKMFTAVGDIPDETIRKIRRELRELE